MKATQLIKEQLRDRENFIANRFEGAKANENVLKILGLSLSFLFAYGFIIGLNHSFLQASVTAVKLPFLFLITTFICFPTLYFFLAILKFEFSSFKLIALLLASMSIMSICFAVFSPIALFFLITTNSYVFFKLVNVLIFAIGGFLGLHTFYKNIKSQMQTIESPSQKSRINFILKAWLCLYALIGSQLSFSISPFFGDPEKGFMLFTDTQRSFFVDIINSISLLMT